MPQTNLTALLLGLGRATADGFNGLLVPTPAVLLNNAGAGIEVTVNKTAPANDAAFAFKTGFSARALFGLLGDDDFRVKLSPDGSTFHDALQIDRSSGQVELPKPVVPPGLAAAPSPAAIGKIAVYARRKPSLHLHRESGFSGEAGQLQFRAGLLSGDLNADRGRRLRGFHQGSVRAWRERHPPVSLMPPWRAFWRWERPEDPRYPIDGADVATKGFRGEWFA